MHKLLNEPYYPCDTAAMRREGRVLPTGAVSLLDHEHYPFKTNPPKLVRALLFEYDFTRLDSSWARRTALNATVVKGGEFGCHRQSRAFRQTWCSFPYRYHQLRHHSSFHRFISHISPPSSGTPVLVAGEPVWKRKFVREYLPPLGTSDASLVQFLDHHGIRGQSPNADAGDQTCAAVEDDSEGSGGRELSKYTATHLYLRSRARALANGKGAPTEAGHAERVTFAILKAKLVLFGTQ